MVDWELRSSLKRSGDPDCWRRGWCGWTKWTKCSLHFLEQPMPTSLEIEEVKRSGLFVINPCKANVHEFGSEKSECIHHFWPRPCEHHATSFRDLSFRRSGLVVFNSSEANNPKNDDYYVNMVDTWDDNFIQKFTTYCLRSLKVRPTWTWTGSISVHSNFTCVGC